MSGGQGRRGRFPTTEWSLVEASADPAGRAALGQLLERYLPALRAHIRFKTGWDDSSVDDLLQSFISDVVLGKAVLARASEARGRFRTYVLTILDRFVSNELRSRRTQKRGANRTVSLDAADALDAPHRAPGPSQAFDIEWAKGVLAQAVQRMRQCCEKSGRLDMWEVFHCRVLSPATDHGIPVAYARIVEQFGFDSPGRAFSAMVNAKRTFARVLREVVGEYLADPTQIDQEILQLRAILARGSA